MRGAAGLIDGSVGGSVGGLVVSMRGAAGLIDGSVGGSVGHAFGAAVPELGGSRIGGSAQRLGIRLLEVRSLLFANIAQVVHGAGRHAGIALRDAGHVGNAAFAVGHARHPFLDARILVEGVGLCRGVHGKGVLAGIRGLDAGEQGLGAGHQVRRQCRLVSGFLGSRTDHGKDSLCPDIFLSRQARA